MWIYYVDSLVCIERTGPSRIRRGGDTLAHKHDVLRYLREKLWESRTAIELVENRLRHEIYFLVVNMTSHKNSFNKHLHWNVNWNIDFVADMTQIEIVFLLLSNERISHIHTKSIDASLCREKMLLFSLRESFKMQVRTKHGNQLSAQKMSINQANVCDHQSNLFLNPTFIIEILHKYRVYSDLPTFLFS